MTIKAKKSKINLREKLAELLNFRQIRDRLDGLGLYIGKDRTGTAENVAVRGGANVDDLQLAEISAALGGTAVDVFVYDTRNDSDGGKWRERTSHTSWYNEELNTATRGGRREFPAVAVIVAESNKVTIYDGDDPDLNMWMVFEATFNMNLITATTGTTISSLFALNGVVCVGANGSSPHLTPIDFISERSGHYTTSGNKYFLFDISKRNNTSSPAHGSYDSTVAIVNSAVNDVAMTVLPNAPIDSDTGLPIPTIAVATDGGISVIKDDGSVISTQSSIDYRVHKIDLQSNSNLFAAVSHSNNNNYAVVWANNYTNISGLDWQVYANWNNIGGFYYRYLYSSSLTFAGGDIDATYAISDITTDSIGGLYGLTKTDKNPSDFDAGMVNYISSTYNTGWMPGGTKLATLSDTKIEKVGVDKTTELVTNGTFDSNTAEWSGDSGGVISWNSGGFATVTNTAEDHTYAIRQSGNNNLQPGQNYILSARIRPTFTGSYKFRVRVGSPEVEIYSTTTGLTSGQWTTITTPVFKVDAESVNIELGSNTAAAGITQFDIDDISITKTGELITNGTFDNGVEGWGTGTNSTFDPSTGQAVVGGTYSSGGYIYQTDINFIEGKTYTVSVEVVSFTGAHAAFYVGPSSNGVVATTTGYHSFTFVYNSSLGGVVPLYLQTATSGETATFDNISIRLAEDDRSVNDNGLQIFGEITKSPVAPGADLVAYSGFSANNYLMQPYNSDLNFGTGDFCIMGWMKTNTISSGGRLINIQSSDKYLNVESHSVNRVRIDFNLGDISTTITGTTAVWTATWNQVLIVRRGDVMSIYINGNLDLAVDGFDSLSLDDDDAVTTLGVDYSKVQPFDGSLALWRISATAPTAEQIAKIYRDEKVLFQDGAQATLYGTSDAVTALSYDDKTELLHVGTSSGRSDFAGLRRINNTTTAVTTSISASNNLIAEQ